MSRATLRNRLEKLEEVNGGIRKYHIGFFSKKKAKKLDKPGHVVVCLSLHKTKKEAQHEY